MLRTLFIILSICQPLLLLTKAMDFGIFSRLVGMFSLACTLLITIAAFFENGFKNNKHITSFVLVVICLVISIFQQDVSYDAIVSSLMFISMTSCWLIYPLLVDDKLFKVIKFSFILQTIVIVMLSFSSVSHLAKSAEDGIYYSESLTMGLNNSNQTAMVLFYLFAFFLYLFDFEGKKLKRVLYLAVAAEIFYLIIQTDSRTSMLSSLFLFCLYFLSKFSIKNYFNRITLSNIFRIITLISPLIFCFLYLYLFDNPALMKIELLGKSLYTGREVIYTDVLTSFQEYKWFGNVSLNGFTNVHNGILTLLLNIGTIGVLFYYIFIFRSTRELVWDLKAQNSNNLAKSILVIAVLFTYLYACTESAVITTSSWFMFYFLTMLILIQTPTDGERV